MSNAAWTTEKPTQEGWYWFKDLPESQAWIINVWKVCGGWWMARNGAPSLAGLPDGYYQGPLEPNNQVASAPPPNTIPIRIAVAVGRDGKTWNSCGFGGYSEKENEEYAKEGLGWGESRLSWVTANVPIPEKDAEIVGVVES